MAPVLKTWVVVVVWVGLAAIFSKWGVEGQVQHVVGEDRGWEPHSDVVSWSSGRTFRVGDNIWFAYSVAHGMIAELKSEKEYLSCDVRNAIKKYVNGLDRVLLEREGIRYFVSSNMESCKKGLKLPVHVMPTLSSHHLKVNTSDSSATADGPTAPSVAAHRGASFILLVAAFWLSYIFIFM